ncbi:MAG: HD domain-containing protein [Dehalobacterium sp.]|jgi:nicotinic acid mononucleotide adenylyltransferase
MPLLTVLYNHLTRCLLSSDWLQQFTIEKKEIEKLFADTIFQEKLESVAKSNCYSCQAVLDLTQNALNDIAGQESPKDWLPFLCQYAISKSFPLTVAQPITGRLKAAGDFYLKMLREVGTFCRNWTRETSWSAKYPLNFLTEKEINQLEYGEEYLRFLTAFQEDYVYEMMELVQEVRGFNTLDHSLGVHYLALDIGRQLANLGQNIDLGRVSGAAAVHDIGKFGCHDEEIKRIPYLHYYYTGEWFKRHQITYIRQIAMNHSTWDLELENLSLESLILIYADFRVKQRDDQMRIYPLDESYHVILSKLDQVDEQKRQRYDKVFAKLKDFEDYLKFIGVQVDPETRVKKPAPQREVNYALLQGDEIVQNLKYLAIQYNITMMYQLRDEHASNTLLEMARSEDDSYNLRTFLKTFDEYSTYLTQKQKLNAIEYLYDQLIHPEDDIRRYSAKLIGTLMATFDEVFSKEIPPGVCLPEPDLGSEDLLEQYLHLFLQPDHKIIPLHRSWISQSVAPMIEALFHSALTGKKENYRKIILGYFQEPLEKNRSYEIFLIEGAQHLPVLDDGEGLRCLYRYLMEQLKNPEDQIRICAWETTDHFLSVLPADSTLAREMKKMMASAADHLPLPAENYLRWQVVQKLNLPPEIVAQYRQNYLLDEPHIPDLFLSNLKTAVSGVIKRNQVRVLLDYCLEHREIEVVHTSMHFCNLLKTSNVEAVRNQAGDALIRIFPLLSWEERNDVVVELLGALEVRGYQFTEIPYYLGRLLINLSPEELDEIISDLEELVQQPNPRLINLIFRTVGSCIEYYPQYRLNFAESSQLFYERLKRMMCLILGGLGNYHIRIKQMAFTVLGRVLASTELSGGEKGKILQLIGKKLLNLLLNDPTKPLVFLTNAAGLNHIYRYVSDRIFAPDEYSVPITPKVAFFPGSFDPYSLSHKEITRNIRDLGFEVYLQMDEFSWSKHTLPYHLRRNIVEMSLGNELGCYLFPEDAQINIAHKGDLKRLKAHFPGREVYLVVGSDVILHASAYQMAEGADSIYEMPHIILVRQREKIRTGVEENLLEKQLQKIKGEILYLDLPPQYDEISSTQIRSYVDENRDISSLVDPLAEQYIYEFGFYRREPKFRTLMADISLKVEVVKELTPGLFQELATFQPQINQDEQGLSLLSSRMEREGARLILIRDHNSRHLLGFSLFHSIRVQDLYQEFNNSSICQYIRDHGVGSMVLICGIYLGKNPEDEGLAREILNETLAYCLAREFHFAIYRNIWDNHVYFDEILTRHGFVQLNYQPEQPVFVVNMNDPCTLMLNMEPMIKEPLRSSPTVIRRIAATRRKLQSVITQLYPGNLILTLDEKRIHEVLVEKICQENGVSTIPAQPRQLGPAMCVPFGNILNRYLVPNTVTKPLYTEKYFKPNMKDNIIAHLPYYLSLENQIKILHSFNRPVILVDDLLHKGYRIKAIDDKLHQGKIQVQKVFTGILSGRGKELMEMQQRQVEGAYFVPRIKVWFNEDILYPFIGGDTLWRGSFLERNLIPSVNYILPYAFPQYIVDASKEAILALSRTCIENAMDMLQALEMDYAAQNGRTLTLERLGDVFIIPRYPDQGRSMFYDLKQRPSHYLQNDLERLIRIKEFGEESGG